MKIKDLNVGERGVVLSVSCAEPLSDRLSSLGIRPGAEIRLWKVSLFKKTYLVGAAGSRIAMRKEVAECVTVRKA